MSLPRVFPIFPLESVVLVPGALLPLHIFEPRYRDMVEDCLDGHGMLAMAMPVADRAPDDARPPVERVCSLGRIEDHVRHPDGRFDILLRGVSRVTIEQELPPERSYRVVVARALPDVEQAQIDPLPRLTAILDRLSIDDTARAALTQLPAGRALDLVLVRLPLTARQKHRVHAEPTVGRRLDAVERILDVLLRGATPPEFGKGDPRLN